ncbi:hypothetical protein Ri1_29260 [Aeromonas dhakensis]|nr:hypothetical protein Ri1_29260 [Aeromonas dhakensis]
MASLLAAFAPTPAMLTSAQGLLALVGAMIMPGVFGTIRCTFQEENERAIALGQWETVRVAGRSSGR